MFEFLKRRIEQKQAKIAVIGLGYVGLPLAVHFAKANFRVAGLDTDCDRIERIQNGISYISDVPASSLAALVKKGQLTAHREFTILKDTDVIIICVPTPIKKRYTPDISYILEAVRTVQKYLKKGTLVILESTTYPGTTEELILPELEKSGLKLDRDFFLAFSPERIDPGNKVFTLNRIPKVVGGLSQKSTALTQLLYQKIIPQVHTVSSAKAAEMTKLLENSFRIVNIGWINEMAMVCSQLGIDIWEVIDAAKTKPFGFMPFYPGLGVGGHCIPEDPLYLYWKAKLHGFDLKFIKLASQINRRMPLYVIDRLERILQKQNKSLLKAKLLVIGVTYKKDVKDLRRSPPLKLIDVLKQKGCRVQFFDPLIPYLKRKNIHLRSIPLTRENLKDYDCVVIAVDHSGVNYKFILDHAKIIFDLRNVFKNVRNKKVIKL